MDCVVLGGGVRVDLTGSSDPTGGKGSVIMLVPNEGVLTG